MSVNSGDMSDYQRRLQARTEAINISNLGFLSVNKPKWISPQRMKRYVQYVIAQAILDNIAQAENMLCVRNIFPHHDLLDGNQDRLASDEWIQPSQVVNTGYRIDEQPGYRMNNTTVDLYRTGINCHYLQKVYLLYGFKNMKYFSQPRREDEVISTQAEVGGPAEVFLSSLYIKRGNVKLIDIPDMSLINDIGYIFLQTPILFKRGDEMNIQGTTKSNAQGNTDNIKLCAIIGEALGAQVTG